VFEAIRIRKAANYLLDGLRQTDLSTATLNIKTSGIHVSFLIAALGVMAIRNLLPADEESAAEQRSASVIAAGLVTKARITQGISARSVQLDATRN